MGVDTHLYLNTRWRLDDIIDVIESTQKCEVNVSSHDDKSLIGCFSLDVKERSIFMIVNSQTPIGSATYLKLHADKEAHQIFRDIAERLGGILEEYDSDGKMEFINGNMWEEDGLPYFVKYAITKDGIEPDNVTDFIKSKEAWHKKVNA